MIQQEMTEVTEEMAREYCKRIGENPDSSWRYVQEDLWNFFKLADFYMEHRNDKTD